MATGSGQHSPTRTTSAARTESSKPATGKPDLEERIAALETKLAEVIHHCGHQPADSA